MAMTAGRAGGDLESDLWTLCEWAWVTSVNPPVSSPVNLHFPTNAFWSHCYQGSVQGVERWSPKKTFTSQNLRRARRSHKIMAKWLEP